MSAAKAVLIGGVLFGIGAWFLHSKSASASPVTTWPAGWTPPPDSDTQTIPPGAGNPTTLKLTVTRWTQTADASGRQPGRWILMQNAANPLNDWIVLFAQQIEGQPDRLGIVQSSGSPLAGLMAQAVAAGLIE